MTLDELRKRFEAMERLVAEVVADMDDGASRCGCCGVIRYSNFTDHQCLQEMGAIRTKLTRWIGRTRATEWQHGGTHGSGDGGSESR